MDAGAVRIDANTGEDDRGTGRVDASMDPSDASPDASMDPGDASRDASEAGDAGLASPDAADPPRPGPACGEDLDVDNGRVTIDLGELPAASEFVGDPTTPGPHPVNERAVQVPIRAGNFEAAGYAVELSEGTLAATLYSPADAGSAQGPFPLVLVLPGFQASYTQYAHFARHFASHGMVVLGVDTRSEATSASHDKEAWEVSQTLDLLLSPQFPEQARIDPEKVAVAGHSKGGKVAFFAAAVDPRIDQVIAWDPQNAGGPPCFVDPTTCHTLPVAPNCAAEGAGLPAAEGILSNLHAATLVLGVPPDALVTPDPDHNAEHFYRGAPSPAAFVRFDDGHLAWLEPPLGNAEVIRVSQAVQIATLLSRFGNRTGLDAWLPGGDFLATQTGNVLDVRVK